MKKTKLIEILSPQTNISRRKLLDLLKTGAILINGIPAESLTQLVTIKDKITLQNKPIHHTIKLHYFKFNKPNNIISTLTDPKGRRCLSEFMSKLPPACQPVGRLDRTTTGLMIFTNDGDLANKLLHPSYQVIKRYRVNLPSRLSHAKLRQLSQGLILEDGPIQFSAIEVQDDTTLIVSLHEGRNRIVRRSFEAIGYPNIKLKRLSIANIQLQHLKEGQFKPISKAELATLKNSLKQTRNN